MLHSNPTPQPDGPFQPSSSLVPIQHDVSAEYHLKMGKSLYHSYLARSRQQDLDAAVQHFQKAVEIEPNMAEAYVQLASALWDQGAINLELAQFYCETALKLDEKQADANLFLGYFLQRAGFLEDALAQYNMAVKKNFWRSTRSRIAMSNILLKQAVQVESKGLQLVLAARGVSQFLVGCAFLPLDKQTCFLLKEAFMADAQVYSLNWLSKGLKSVKLHTLARKVYALGTRLMPQEPLFYHMLGDDYLYELKDAQEAIYWYTRAQSLDPHNLNLLKKLGKAYTQANETSAALSTYTKVVEIGGDDFDTLYQMAQIYTTEEAYFKALYYFKEAEKFQPHYPYLHSNIAYILFKMDDVEGAFEKYKAAFEYGTEPIWLSTVAQTLGTICYQVFEDTEQALEYFQQSLHFNPENEDTMAMVADLYFEAGHLEQALTAYQTLLQMVPDSADCYSNIGYILWQMDKNHAAIDAYLTAIYYDANSYIAHNNLGVIYLDEASAPDKALPLFEKALSLKSDYTLACFNIGRALEVMGKTLEAAEFYSQALSLNQSNPELEDAEIQEYLDHLFD